MHHRILRATALAVAAAAAIGLVGCSSDGSSGDTKTVTFLSWDAEATMQPLIDMFEEEHPEYTVEASYAPPVQEYISTLQTRLSSGTAPDVFIITAENKNEIMEGALARDISDQSWTDELGSAEKATYTREGALYGAAISSWGGGIVYNAALLDQVGYTEPPATWGEFLDLSKKLKDAGITPFLEAGDGIPITVAALVGLENDARDGQLDPEIWAGDTTFAETWTEPLTKFRELLDDGLMDSAAAGLTGAQVYTEFTNGNVAMTTTGSWGLGGIRDAAPDMEVGFFAVPGDDATYWAGAVSPGYAVNAKATNEEGALAFVEFLTSAEAVEAYQTATKQITTTSNFEPVLDEALTGMAGDVREGRFYLPQVSWLNNSAALNTEAVSLIQELILGSISPADAAAGLDAKLAEVNG